MVSAGQKTLYISDLDGTLLRRDQTVSPFTAEVINALTARGMHFSYATARSIVTASKITAPLTQNIPVIVYNGTFIVENGTGHILASHEFTPEEAERILGILAAGGVHPFVYAHIDGAERYSFSPDHMTDGMRRFHATRRDSRERAVPLSAAADGSVFHFSCIDTPERLIPLYEALRGEFPCVCYKEIYSGDHWLEIMPQGATKADAARTLRDMLGCTRIVAFGDGVNDIPLFEAADECYAVANADDALKAIAAGVIGSNEEDGVARWLAEHAAEVDKAIIER